MSLANEMSEEIFHCLLDRLFGMNSLSYTVGCFGVAKVRFEPITLMVRQQLHHYSTVLPDHVSGVL